MVDGLWEEKEGRDKGDSYESSSWDEQLSLRCLVWYQSLGRR